MKNARCARVRARLARTAASCWQLPVGVYVDGTGSDECTGCMMTAVGMALPPVSAAVRRAYPLKLVLPGRVPYRYRIPVYTYSTHTHTSCVTQPQRSPLHSPTQPAPCLRIPPPRPVTLSGLRPSPWPNHPFF